MLCPLPVIELAKRIGEVEVGEVVGRRRRPTRPRRYDVPAWCRMREQEYVGEDLADDGVPRYLVRRLS